MLSATSLGPRLGWATAMAAAFALLWIAVAPSAQGGRLEIAASLLAVLISGLSLRNAAERVRRVRTWVTLGLATWAGSQLAVMLPPSAAGTGYIGPSVALLGGVLVAAGGAYRATLTGRMSGREEATVYLDAAIVAGAASALVLLGFRGLIDDAGNLSLPMVHALLVFTILAGTLLLDLAVLAELRATGAYLVLLGLVIAGGGFVARSIGVSSTIEPLIEATVALGIVVVAAGTATWSDRVDPHPAYARVAAHLRWWLPLAAVVITLLLLFGGGQETGPAAFLTRASVVLVLAGAVVRQSLLVTERGGLLAATRGRSEQLERRLASQRQLLIITERLLVNRERMGVFETVADTLAEVVPYDTLSIYLVDNDGGCLVPILARDEYAEQILASRPALGAGITGDVIANGEAEVINDAAHDPRVAQVPGTPEDEGEAMIVAPIRSHEGVIGALNIYRRSRHFDDDDLELVRLFTNHVAIALENASIHAQLVEAAVTDPLTGLPNRRGFEERIGEALLRRSRARTGVAVLFLDLDGFKLVNDSLGHSVGDDALRAVAQRLRSHARRTETVARLGGDEFAVLCEGAHTEVAASAIASRMIKALADPLVVGGRSILLRASIGVALDRGRSDVTAADLLRDADTAMYLAKRTNPGGLQVHEPSMHSAQLARLELHGELREALAQHALRLAYQPMVDLKTNELVAVEALLRWDRPDGPLDPQELVELAEESGQIVALGAWVRLQACRAARSWPGHVRLSVNIAPRELMEASFAASIEKVLAATGFSPDRLMLEITESVMLADETRAVAALRHLRARGVHVAVDDFGTGYSSLSYLQRLPVDVLKIDRSFVSGLGEEAEKSAIVEATIAFAKALHLSVVAEGIETERQLRHLRTLGCPWGQGFLFMPPVQIEQLAAVLGTLAERRLPVAARTRRDAA